MRAVYCMRIFNVWIIIVSACLLNITFQKSLSIHFILSNVITFPNNHSHKPITTIKVLQHQSSIPTFYDMTSIPHTDVFLKFFEHRVVEEKIIYVRNSPCFHIVALRAVHVAVNEVSGWQFRYWCDIHNVVPQPCSKCSRKVAGFFQRSAFISLVTRLEFFKKSNLNLILIRVQTRLASLINTRLCCTGFMKCLMNLHAKMSLLFFYFNNEPQQMV